MTGRHEQGRLFGGLPQPEPERLRDEALAQVERNAHDLWKEAAMLTLDRLCRERSEVSSWDVTQRMGTDYPDIGTHDLRALGPVFMAYKREGRITPNGLGKHPKRHATIMRIWRVVK